MNTKELTTFITKNIGWNKTDLISYCEKNYVTIKFQDDLAILDYFANLTTNQWNDFNRVCRGVIIDLTKQKIISHPFNKFESYNSDPSSINDIQDDFYVTEKYDGSMIECYKYKNNICCATRSSLDSEQSRFAKTILTNKYPQIENLFSTACYTVIFEYISPDNKVHIDYQEEDLIVLGIRNLETGELLNYTALQEIANQYHLTIAKKIDITLDELILLAKQGDFTTLEEGWIINYHNKFIKLKTWHYLVKLKLIRYGLTKKKMIDNFLSLSEDEIKTAIANYPPIIQNDALTFYDKFLTDYQSVKDDIIKEYHDITKIQGIDSDKDFALYVKDNCDKSRSMFMFSLRKGKSIEKSLKKYFPECIDYYQHESVTEIEKLKEWAFNYVD